MDVAKNIVDLDFISTPKIGWPKDEALHVTSDLSYNTLMVYGKCTPTWHHTGTGHHNIFLNDPSRYIDMKSVHGCRYCMQLMGPFQRIMHLNIRNDYGKAISL